MLDNGFGTMDASVFFAILVCLVVSAAPATGQVYKWVDEKGAVHFSSSPPRTPPAGPVELRDSKPPPPVAEGHPQFPVEQKARVGERRPADAAEEPEGADGNDWPVEPGERTDVVQPDEGSIYDPDVIDAIRRQQLRDRLSAPPSVGSGAPARVAPRSGRR
jgi:hypothetical protein